MITCTEKTAIVLTLFALLSGILWLWNAARFFSCDFRAPYACEAIHATGVLVPPLALVTVWFETDTKPAGEQKE